MVPKTLFLVGLELTRFPTSDVAGDVVADSVAGTAPGVVALGPYDGPAIQPYVSWRGAALEFGVAPGLALRTASSDGESTTQTVQWRVEGRSRWNRGPALVGLDVAYGDGSARRGDVIIAEGTPILEVAPTVGVRGELADHFDLVLRARWPVRFVDGAIGLGLAGALGLEWHR